MANADDELPDNVTMIGGNCACNRNALIEQAVTSRSGLKLVKPL